MRFGEEHVRFALVSSQRSDPGFESFEKRRFPRDSTVFFKRQHAGGSEAVYAGNEGDRGKLWLIVMTTF